MVLLVVCTPKFTKFRLATIIGAGPRTGCFSARLRRRGSSRPVFMNAQSVGLFGTFYAAIYGIAMAKKIGPLPHDKVNL